ncbi:hypothetical protein M3J09_010206 [Ascochyta lentis]
MSRGDQVVSGEVDSIADSFYSYRRTNGLESTKRSSYTVNRQVAFF